VSPPEVLPYVDEHRITVPAPRAQVWTGLCRYIDSFLADLQRSPLTRLLGAEPRAGFEIASAVPDARLDLTGRHRFARYRLQFDLADAADDRTMLTARTFAAFPGPHGRVYGALVLRTGAHVAATNHILRCVRRTSLSAGTESGEESYAAD
jgi:hypothetical protein